MEFDELEHVRRRSKHRPACGRAPATPPGTPALRAGVPGDVCTGDLPASAREGETCHWWRRPTVTAAGVVTFYDDTGARWLAENGL
jgi:hypothetical protein